MLGSLLVSSTDVKKIGSDEGIKMELSDGKVLGNIIGNVDEIKLEHDIQARIFIWVVW